ncbi:MAG: efflux RND transporter periplasmic adaptor subunit [Gemmatimonadales bacterium]|nr:MAG: efflux RND transporter periplasmic adaptor subunit [Gemmatimonadales bacterium]
MGLPVPDSRTLVRPGTRPRTRKLIPGGRQYSAYSSGGRRLRPAADLAGSGPAGVRFLSLVLVVREGHGHHHDRRIFGRRVFVAPVSGRAGLCGIRALDGRPARKRMSVRPAVPGAGLAHGKHLGKREMDDPGQGGMLCSASGKAIAPRGSRNQAGVGTGMRTSICRTLALSALAVFFMTGCSQNGGSERGAQGGPGSGGGSADKAIPIAAVTVQPRDLARTVAVTGPVEPIRTVMVNAQAGGTVLTVLVQEGDRVHSGQLMAELDARETAAQLQRARAVLANADAAFQRAEHLQANDLNSAAEVDVLRSAFAIAQADVQLWRTRLAFSRITAPIPGVVTAKRVEKGSTVSANGAMFTLADDSLLVVRVRVSELDVVHLEPGRPATLQLDAYPGVPISGYIRRIFPSADSSSRLVPVETVLGPLPTGVVARPGYLARVEFALDSRSGVLAVPAAAIGVSEGGAFVYVVAADTLSRRPVETGLTTAGWIEITRGLEPGERVVSSGHVNLRQGARVRISEPAAAAGTTP